MNGTERPDVRFERVYKDRFGAVYAYVLRRVAASDVADLVAEVFTVAWRRLDDLPAPPHDLPWLYVVARRVVSQHGRTRCRRARLLVRLTRETRWLGTPVVPGDGGELGDRVAAAVAALRPRDRELLRLVTWEGLSHVEVALVLGCSANAVTLRWRRITRRLEQRLTMPDRQTGGLRVEERRRAGEGT